MARAGRKQQAKSSHPVTNSHARRQWRRILSVPDDEIERLRGLLHEMVKRSGRSYRELERALNLGHGYLNHLFSGRMEFKFRHVVLLGEALGFTLNDFFQQAYPVRRHEPGWPMREMEEGFAEAGTRLRPPQGAPSLDRDALKDTIREVLAELLLGTVGQPHPEEKRRRAKKPRSRSRKRPGPSA